MNLPNKLSVARMAMIPVMVLLMLPGTLVCSLLAAAVFGAAAITDYFDGHIARTRNLITDFGKFIDPVADKLLVLSAMVMLIHNGLLPAWVVVIVLARELAVDGLRLVAGTHGRVIAAGWLGKVKTASQMFCILWLMILRAPVLTALGYTTFSFLSLISTLGAFWVVIITLWSGIDYFLRNGRFLQGRSPWTPPGD